MKHKKSNLLNLLLLNLLANRFFMPCNYFLLKYLVVTFFFPTFALSITETLYGKHYKAIQTPIWVVGLSVWHSAFYPPPLGFWGSGKSPCCSPFHSYSLLMRKRRYPVVSVHRRFPSPGEVRAACAQLPMAACLVLK